MSRKPHTLNIVSREESRQKIDAEALLVCERGNIFEVCSSNSSSVSVKSRITKLKSDYVFNSLYFQSMDV